MDVYATQVYEDTPHTFSLQLHRLGVYSFGVGAYQPPKKDDEPLDDSGEVIVMSEPLFPDTENNEEEP